MLEVGVLFTLVRFSIFSKLCIPFSEKILDIIKELVMNLCKFPRLLQPDESRKVK
jgi:hypothetical protein